MPRTRIPCLALTGALLIVAGGFLRPAAAEDEMAMI